MWTAREKILNHGKVRQIAIEDNGKPLWYSDVVEGWQSSSSFREFFITLLADVPYGAYFWETPPVTKNSFQDVFEFVLVDSPELGGVTASPSAFQGHFQGARQDRSVVTFANLGKDAFLVAPCPRASSSVYPHLAAFARGAPMDQQHALWEQVGEAIVARLNERKLWVSTAGLGVYWLHVRLDSYPKYYSFAPYRS
ncbi:MAG: hypothetical protein V3R51_00655, partial [Gammaproteobacteria bacterium]